MQTQLVQVVFSFHSQSNQQLQSQRPTLWAHSLINCLWHASHSRCSGLCIVCMCMSVCFQCVCCVCIVCMCTCKPLCACVCLHIPVNGMFLPKIMFYAVIITELCVVCMLVCTYVFTYTGQWHVPTQNHVLCCNNYRAFNILHWFMVCFKTISFLRNNKVLPHLTKLIVHDLFNVDRNHTMFTLQWTRM